MKCFSLFLLLIFSFYIGFSQSPPPKYEFRGVWIATVKNLDWPSRSDLDSETQQQEFIEMLDEQVANGMNAVVVQVRPAADALYDSPYEPWSEWLTGTQGKPPEPYYDPLEFMIEESHKRGLEFHAWFNPYRAAANADAVSLLAEDHVVKQNPDWFIRYGNSLLFDPGLPAARDFVINVILDVARRYNIDAVHFDDYFYPYRIQGEEFQDNYSFEMYGEGFENRDDWRRNNVDELIRILHDSLITINPEILFGISPFGVWRNQDKDPQGSATRAGQTCYDDLYADVRKWLEEGWIDYVAPQIYFSIGYPPAAFDELINWWSLNSFGKQVFVGHAPYKVGNNKDSNWDDPNEIPKQIKLTRDYGAIQGSIYFRAGFLTQNPLGITDSLRGNYYRLGALLPPRTEIDNIPPAAPVSLISESDKAGIALVWEDGGIEEDARYYVIYRGEGRDLPLATPTNMIVRLGDYPRYFLDENTRFLKKYHYIITTIDPFQNESKPSEIRSQRRWSWTKKKKTKKRKKRK
ncbi:UNVERIFIED_CONTAM: hypothetical protein GTU68_020002 [Idotea baltica]|nr:hypothetical protein [Idotea baltica]